MGTRCRNTCSRRCAERDLGCADLDPGHLLAQRWAQFHRQQCGDGRAPAATTVSCWDHRRLKWNAGTLYPITTHTRGTIACCLHGCAVAPPGTLRVCSWSDRGHYGVHPCRWSPGGRCRNSECGLLGQLPPPAYCGRFLGDLAPFTGLRDLTPHHGRNASAASIGGHLRRFSGRRNRRIYRSILFDSNHCQYAYRLEALAADICRRRWERQGMKLLTAAFLNSAMLIGTAALALPPLFFKPAEVVSATNAQYPPNSIAEGVVVLDVSLTERGQVVEVGALRDIPSLTSAAASEVQSWRFKPASQDGMVQASAMTVAFVYRPPVSVWKPPSFTPALPNPGSSTNAYMPAGIVSVGYAEYPVNSVVSGAVVVQVTVDDSGKIERVKVIRKMAGFTGFALRAVKQWRFQPAQLEGEPVASNVAIAFIFARPNLNPF